MFQRVFGHYDGLVRSAFRARAPNLIQYAQVAVPSPAIAATVFNNQNGVCTVDQWARRSMFLDAGGAGHPVRGARRVYHCHILEHEDGGMMARIQVVPHAIEERSDRGE
jgi:hypothetical protein